MIGAIIGDIAGSTYEFHSIKTKGFPLFAPGSNTTDDSLMSIAVASALIQTGKDEDFKTSVVSSIFNHRHKYDSLYISYDEPIRPVAGDHGVTLYDGCKHAVGGPLILDFVNAAAKYSGYDVADILKEIQRKSDWYDEKYGKTGSNGVEEH